MRLSKVRIQNYRSIIDTEEFEVENGKTILVGPNEAGKSAVLQALQQINPPAGVKQWTCHAFVPLRLLIYAAFRSKAQGLFQPSAECFLRAL